MARSAAEAIVSGGARTSLSSRDEALTAARRVAAKAGECAGQTERDRVLPQATIDALKAEGLFGVMRPVQFGGSELGYETLVDAAATLAASCGSTGWVYAVLCGHDWFLAQFDERAQRDVWEENPDALISTVFRLGGAATEVEGGYLLARGEGRFCSGVDFADWVIVGGAIEREGEPPEASFFLVPSSDIEIVDDWYTAGLRGTGSKTIRIDGAFVPAHRRVAVSDLQQGTTPAPPDRPSLFRAPFVISQPFSLIGTSLGLTDAALAGYGSGLAKRAAGADAEALAELSPTFARYARMRLEFDAARSLVSSNCRRLDSLDDATTLDDAERAQMLFELAHAAQACRRIVNSVYELSGGSGIYDNSPIQRIWRDVNASAAHAAFVEDPAAAAAGRASLGLPPSRSARR